MKRELEKEENIINKKIKLETNEETEEKRIQKKKMVIIFGYLGKNYLGSTYTKESSEKTIEGALFEAIYKSDCVDKRNDTPQKNSLSIASKTDKGIKNKNKKGVDAIINIISIKLHEIEKLQERIEEYLPKDIIIYEIKRATKNFNPRNNCDGRMYEYILPSFVFEKQKEIKQNEEIIIVGDDFDLKKINYNYDLPEEDFLKLKKIIKNYEGIFQNFLKGRKSYHNFTKRGSKESKDSYIRIIKEFTVTNKFSIKDLQFVKFRIIGESFMLNQIRKMMGLIILIMRGNKYLFIILKKRLFK
jgi:tRNA pseudouridine38-40 synthase